MGRPGLRLFQPGHLPSEASFSLTTSAIPARGPAARSGLRPSEEPEAGLLPGTPLPPTPLSQAAGLGVGAGKFLQQPEVSRPGPRVLFLRLLPVSRNLARAGPAGPLRRCPPSPSLGGRPGRLERRRRLGFLSSPLAGFPPAHLPLTQLCCHPSPVTCDAQGLRPLGSVPRVCPSYLLLAPVPFPLYPSLPGLCHPSFASALQQHKPMCSRLSSTPEFYASSRPFPTAYNALGKPPLTRQTPTHPSRSAQHHPL